MEKIVIQGGSSEIVEKKSRFIANVKAVNSEEEAVAFINEIKKKHYDARHNCMAYVVNGVSRFSDDGEPSGTAGKPILDVITGRELTNVVVVVTRYFGGILLGTGGLVRAYQKAAVEGIEDSKVAIKNSGMKFEINTDYNGLGKIQYIAASDEVHIINTEYLEDVKITVVCDNEKYDNFIKKIVEATSGRARISETEVVEYYNLETSIQII